MGVGMPIDGRKHPKHQQHDSGEGQGAQQHFPGKRVDI